MDSPVPALAPHLAKALAALREGGVNPTDAEIVWLGRLRHKCDNPDDGSIPWVMGAPIEYGGVAFYPVHRLAESWFLRAFKLFDGDDEMQIAAFLFAHAHSGIGDTTVRKYVTAGAIRDTLVEWWDELPIHGEQVPVLCEALRKLDGEGESVPDADEKTECAHIACTSSVPTSIAALCKAFPGVSPEYWLTDISSADSMEMLVSVGSGGSWAESYERRTAVANWLKAVKWVWRNHQNAE